MSRGDQVSGGQQLPKDLGQAGHGKHLGYVAVLEKDVGRESPS